MLKQYVLCCIVPHARSLKPPEDALSADNAWSRQAGPRALEWKHIDLERRGNIVPTIGD
ncbi:ADP-ribosylation factor-like protein 6-like isoform X1 [Anopheles sinensis]|uniref:ADP-ribosylation factor-like protein 6-like isoform X1 n=1 Tax=Anopheles sinensis TaxID=74873 RepID=A0A084VWI4_ANOSI|nr:ADP-ribosylation factor-like protein 6-like isoform X1 [Anopheles sinensis]